MSVRRNHLAGATSPYLLQHADNPVDWWPWCDEALQMAHTQGRPILLSIGYSACHWCHVMAHESFEDPATAAVMNELFINIKVDREERPDLDHLYQTAHQLLARRGGGWPLTVFLMPDDHSPFFAGTYFPPSPRHGLPAFKELLHSIHSAFHDQREAINEQNGALRRALAQMERHDTAATLDAGPLAAGGAELAQRYDRVHAGFGPAPKFPHPTSLDFLLRLGTTKTDSQAREMALTTLTNMANGGIQDLLGGGFCRYSTDSQWMIPHFEKMLYDNGQLLSLYADAWLADARRPLFRHVCERIAEWGMREMQAPDGAYYASLDADSEGEEGRFYVWQPDEVRQLLDPAEYPVFARRYGLDRAPNFDGRWHLHTWVDTDRLAAEHQLTPREVRRLLRRARDKLLAARSTRVRPGTDDKILTSWNALMIKGMAHAGRVLERSDWLSSARDALCWLQTHHWRDGRLLATSRAGDARLPAYLDDHAYLIDAILEVLQEHWDSELLVFACALADILLEHFEDTANGGLFFTADDHERLLQRMKPFADDAMPAGNGIAALALQRLAMLTGEQRYADCGERILRAAWGAIAKMPSAHSALLCALLEYTAASETIIVRGPRDQLADWLAIIKADYRPLRSVYAIPHEANDLPAGLASKSSLPGTTIAYRCIGQQCSAPVDSLAKWIRDS